MMIALLLLVVLLAVWLLADHVTDLLTWVPAQRVPVLPGNMPILGHSLALLSNLHRFHDWLLEEARSVGDGITFVFKLPFTRPFYVLTSPVCVQHVLKTNVENYEKERGWYNVVPVKGHSIDTSDGERWMWQRKLATSIFRLESFKSNVNGVFAQKMGLMHVIMQRAATAHTQLDLHELMHQFTLDSFSSVGFGADLGCLTSPDKGRTLAISSNDAVVKRFGADIIARRRALLANTAANCKQDSDEEGCDEDEAPRDLLSFLLEAVGPDGKPLDDKWVLDMTLKLTIAGDTVAQGLSSALYLLMQHPDVQHKLLAEIKAVLGDAAAEPSFEQIEQLKYARACVLETLRLFPLWGQDIKFAVDPDVLPDGTHIPRNTQVIYSPFIVNRLKSFWGKDADEFRPERWLAMDAEPSPYSFLGFNAGPRICPGQRLAELEAVYLLTCLLARWRFRHAVPGPADYKLSATLPMKQGLQVFVEHCC